LILKTSQNAVKLVKEHRGLNIDIENIPLDDQKTFQMLGRGGTEGLFQLNGEGMTKHLVDLKPTTIHDINAMVALYRPGPMQFIPEYIKRKHNPKLISYLDPVLEPILKQTYGILVYQDDLLIMAHDLAGYTWGEVDKFRKAVGKKIPEEMALQKDKFIKGCIKYSGWSQKKSEEIWAWIEPFAAYGFNKAHSASYGRVAYQTAYMKANFPAEYMCAVLTAEAGDTEKVAGTIVECQRMDIPVLAPEINSSFKDFTVIKGEKDQIRFGLLTIKNLGENIASAIIAERERNGSFKDIEDFVTRVNNKDLNKKSFEALVKCGAMDALGERNTLLANVDQLLIHAKEKQRHHSSGQRSLFGDAAESTLPPLRLVSVPAAKNSEKLMWEKELLGLFVSNHPLQEHQPALRLERVTAIKDIPNVRRPEGMIKVGGIITKTQKIMTKTGRPMVFSWLEDLTSRIELVVFPNILEKYPDMWKENNIVIAKGKVNDRDGALKIICDDIKALVTV